MVPLQWSSIFVMTEKHLPQVQVAEIGYVWEKFKIYNTEIISGNVR